jgi:type IV pilus assembly protein PilQ
MRHSGNRPKRKRNIQRILGLVALLSLVATLAVSGCASQKAAKPDESQATSSIDGKQIIGITASQENGMESVIIEGNDLLTYTSVKQPAPLGIVLYFPDTALGEVPTEYPVDSDIISQVKAQEFSTGGPKTKVEIQLEVDTTYEVTREGNGVKIAFLTPSSDSTEGTTASATETATPVAAAVEAPVVEDVVAEEPATPATLFTNVSTSTQTEHIEIMLEANGIIEEYSAFTLNKPPRIVFDLKQLNSTQKGEQKISVDSPWVKQVRHYDDGQKIRVVLDTNEANLSQFSSKPTNNGLLIYVGADAAMLASKSAVPASTEATAPAWVNRIDFSGEENGKSMVTIGTTRAVQYDVVKTDDQRISIKLENTKLPDYRKRPLITTRFDSAVDRVLPMTAPKSKNTTIISVELREAVPYRVEEKDNIILVHFDASKIPPKPFEAANLPAWQEVMNKTEAELEASITASKGDQVDGEEGISEFFFGERESGEYTGEPIALDFYQTDIKNVFRILGEVSGQNFAIDKDVEGKVTLNLDDPVPWDQVLDLVLQMNQLGKEKRGGIIRIATLTTLRAEEAERKNKLKERRQAENEEALVTAFIPINYAIAKDIAVQHLVLNGNLKQGKSKFNPDRGRISVDDRINTIIISDVPRALERAKEIIRQLDKVTPQVMIESRIVEASSNFSRDLGVTWSMQGGLTRQDNVDQGTIVRVPEYDTEAGTASGTEGIGPIPGFDMLGGTYNWDAALNSPIIDPAAVLGFNFLRIHGTPFVLNAKLLAMEEQGEGKIISSPKVLTLDNEEAFIEQGISYPYQTVEDGEVKIEFRDIVLKLTVIPHVTGDERISMDLEIRKEDLGLVINGEQSFTTKKARTKLLVDDGDTIVIGGIVKATKRDSEEGIPWLRSIPVLGWLFKSQEKIDDKEELLIFITPRIVQLRQRNTDRLGPEMPTIATSGTAG